MNQPIAETGIRGRFLGMLALGLVLTLLALALIKGFLSRTPTVTNARPESTTQAASPDRVKPVPTTPAPAVSEANPAAKAASTPIEQRWGLQVSGVQLGLEGAGIQVSYLVVDPAKAQALSDGTSALYVINQATGDKIGLESLNPQRAGVASQHSRARMMRQGGSFPPNPNSLFAGRSNSFLIPNVGGEVQVGSRLTVVIGDTQVADLIVQ